MREQPEQPGRQAGEAQRADAGDAEVDDRRLAADRREVAVVDVAERLRRLAAQAPQRGWPRPSGPSAWRAGLTPGTGEVAVGPWLSAAARSPTTEISGWSGTLRSGSTTTRPARSSVAPVPRASSAPSGEPATPAAQITVCAASRWLVVAAPSRDLVGRRRRHRSPSPSSRCARRRRGASAARARAPTASARRRRGCAAALDQDHAADASNRCGGTRRQRVLGDLGHRAGHLDAGRAAADDDEGEPGVARGGVGARSACSKAPIIRARMSNASASVFRPGACASQSSWPK